MAAITAREDLSWLPAGLVDSESGIVSRVACDGADGTPEGLPVCAAAALRRSGTSEVGFGKGLTRSEAITGAIGEALEIYAGSSFSVDDLLYESLVDLGGDVLDPRELCLYEESYYDREGFPYARFDPKRPIHWTKGRWLDTDKSVWLPSLTVYHYFPAPSGERFCQVTSNGSATGSSVPDAARRAALELVERDAFMLTWYCRLPATRVILDESMRTGAIEILDPIRKEGARIAVYLLNAGVNIPTALCSARGDGERWPGATLGLGTHPNPRIAIEKAILEMGQTAYSLSGSLIRGEEQIPADASEVQTFRQHALYYLPAQRAAELDFLDASGATIGLFELRDPGEFSLGSLVQELGKEGVRIAFVDLTTPDLKAASLSVVRAVGTNMQQIHCGFGLERTENPRLRRLLRGPVNRAIPPVC